MFLSVEWAKRWLPAVFLLLSLLLPWWTMIDTVLHFWNGDIFYTDLTFSFPWMPKISFTANSQVPSRIDWYSRFWYNQIPSFLFVSILIVAAGLCGLGKNRTRTLGGFLGITGIVTYFLLIFPLIPEIEYSFYGCREMPYFGIAIERSRSGTHTHVWFLSAGFYLALAGSLMLLSPLIRTLIGRIKKRLSSPEQTNEEPI
jgi:hypothetical protein